MALTDTVPAPSPARRGAWTPVLAPLLRSRRLAAALAAAGALQIGLTFCHLGGMECPFVRLTGIPCPGCGLSRACAAGLRGQWRAAARLHAFWPFFVVSVVLFAAAAVLPRRTARRLIVTIDAAERRWFVANLLLVGVVLYWVARLLYAPAEFAHLIATAR